MTTGSTVLRAAARWLEENGYENFDHGIWHKKGCFQSGSMGFQIGTFNAGRLIVRLMDYHCGFDSLPEIELANFPAFLAFIQNLEALNSWLEEPTTVTTKAETIED